MKIYKITSFEEYKQFTALTAEQYEAHLKAITSKIPQKNCTFTIKGFSYAAEVEVDFTVDFLYSSGYPAVNWRERLTCPITGLNNRMRAAIQIFDIFSNTFTSDSIYLMEQTTALYKFFQERYPSLIGSEYLHNMVPFGEDDDRGIRNEDATNLSFESGCFSVILSFDVFEHIYQYKLAFQECYRTLKSGGALIFTVPFNVNSNENIERAIIDDDGHVEHLLPPEYHGDPMSKEGVLCFRHYGWKMLNDLKQIGFIDVCALTFNSQAFGYYTNQIIFYCRKP
jgi:SAM-dependent methyltransferase